MILPWLVLIPAIGGLVAAFAGRSAALARLVALGVLALNLALTLSLWAQAPGASGWVAEYNLAWIPQLGIGIHLAADGLSLPLVALTAFIGLVAVAVSWVEIDERVGQFHLALLLLLAGITGVFLALDLFLFLFFWELMLVPAYFLFFWGQGRTFAASIKFLVFTQVGGLLMMLSVSGLAFLHAQATGTLTFDYIALLGGRLPAAVGMWLMLGFFAGFAVKLPVFPFHTWAPDAYSAAPTAGAVVLSGVMAKTAGYGLLRFLVPLFPEAAASFAPIAMALGVLGIVYGAWLAFAQTDLKRLVAYSSISHMGFVMLGAFAWNEWAVQGVLIVMLAHGVSSAALFTVAGALEARLGTRDLAAMGGLWATAPRLAGLGLLFALASLGLPGLGNFVGEFLVLLGAYRGNVTLAAVGAIGIVFATVYALWMVQRVFHGPPPNTIRIPDLNAREGLILGVLAVAIVALGLFPQPVLDAARPAVANLERAAQRASAVPVDGVSLVRIDGNSSADAEGDGR